MTKDKHESYLHWVDSVSDWLRDKLPNCKSREHQNNLIRSVCTRHRVSEKRVLELVADVLMEAKDED